MNNVNSLTTKSFLSLLICLIAVPAVAEFGATIGHDSEFSDNADLGGDDVETFDQREDRTWLDLELDFERKQWLLQTEYRLTNVHFDSDSPTPQPDNDEITGDTQFTGLWAKRHLQLDINHRRENFLGTPGDLDLQRNLQARDTLSISPRAYVQNNSRQQIYLAGYYTDINYDENANTRVSIDNQTTGWSIGANRRLTKVDSIGIDIQQLETEYDLDIANNVYSRVNVFYAAELRRLNYSVALGFNRSESEDTDASDAPMALINLGYDTGATTIEFSSQYFITDTARGNQALAATGLADSNPSNDSGNGNSQVVERYELFNNSLSISSQLTSTFSATLSLSLADESYAENTDLDQTTAMVSLTLNKSFGANLSVSANANQTDLDFVGDFPTQENTLNRYSLSLRGQWSEQLSWNLAWQLQDRSSASGVNEYQENTLTLGLSYQLRP